MTAVGPKPDMSLMEIPQCSGLPGSPWNQNEDPPHRRTMPKLFRHWERFGVRLEFDRLDVECLWRLVYDWGWTFQKVSK
jgi:hypothetical protein